LYRYIEGVREKLEDLVQETGGGKDLGAGPGDSKRVSLKLPAPPDGAKDALILTGATVVGLYKLHPVDPWLETARLQPLRL
jgi:hypothetical protein